jgi:arginyl-tRNA synthetase
VPISNTFEKFYREHPVIKFTQIKLHDRRLMGWDISGQVLIFGMNLLPAPKP